MPTSPIDQVPDLYLRLFTVHAETEPSLRRRGTLTATIESADDDRLAMSGARCGLPIG